jgi:putative PIN family toxin of toxin-antitoxin system
VRVLLDTNVWLAVLTTDGACRRMWRKIRATSSICASQDVLDELNQKLRLKFGFSARHARLLTTFVRRQTFAVESIEPLPKVCRDPDDDCILAAAINSGCAYLVTGDHDLLVLKRFGTVSIVTPREFMELLSST